MSVRLRTGALFDAARRAGGWPGLALLAAALATFGEAIFTSSAFFQRDILAYWYPHRAVVLKAIGEGSLPLWNPFVGFGAPLLADPQWQLAYPPTWLGLLLPAEAHYKLFAVGHTLFGAAGAWALARRCGLERTAAAVAGGAFALSGPMLSAVSLYHHHVGAAWLPWLLWALEGLLRVPGPGAVLALGAVTGAQLVAGSGDMCLAGALLGGGRLLIHFASRHSRQRLELLGLGAAAGALGLALAAVQVLPTAALAAESLRPRLTVRTNTYWSLHPLSLLDTVVPRLLVELPLSAEVRAELFEGREPLLFCLYFGIVPLSLAALALLTRPRAALAPAAGFLALLAASLGRHSPLYGALLVLPGFSWLRYPQKLLLPAALCLGLLAALGVAAWGTTWSPAARRRARGFAVAALLLTGSAVAAARWVASEPAPLLAALTPVRAAPGEIGNGLALRLLRVALAAAVVAWFVWRRAASDLRPRPGALNALLLLGALDLVAVGGGVNPLAPRRLVGLRPAVLEQLEGAERLHASGEPGCGGAVGGPGERIPSWAQARAFQEALRPPTAARWGLAGSYDGEFTGLGSPWTALFDAASQRLAGSPAGLRLLQIAGVSHVLHLGRSVGDRIVPHAVRSPGVCLLRVYPVERHLPRTYVASRERVAAGPEATLTTLLDPAFDPWSEVVVERSAPVAEASAGRGSARIVARRSNAVIIDAQTEGAGVLVLLDAFSPDWQAVVDGRPAEVLRANGLFRAVHLTPGRHRVRLSYRPWAVGVGAVLSGLGLVCAAGLGLVVRRRRS